MTTRPTNSERLREMLSEATPGEWAVAYWPTPEPHWWIGVHDENWLSSKMAGQITSVIPKEADARLIALAPDAIALLADMGEQMEAFGEILTRSNMPVAEIDERMRNLVAPMMARLDALCGDER